MALRRSPRLRLPIGPSKSGSNEGLDLLPHDCFFLDQKAEAYSFNREVMRIVLWCRDEHSEKIEFGIDQIKK